MTIQATPIPLAFCVSGIACLILAIISELPPKDGEPNLLRPRKEVPITGTFLIVIGITLLLV